MNSLEIYEENKCQTMTYCDYVLLYRLIKKNRPDLVTFYIYSTKIVTYRESIVIVQKPILYFR